MKYIYSEVERVGVVDGSKRPMELVAFSEVNCMDFLCVNLLLNLLLCE